MRKLMFLAIPLLVLGSSAMAQDKPSAMAPAKPMAAGGMGHMIKTTWHCAKPSAQQSLDIGDMPDHSYGIMQGTCDATATAKGFPEKSGQYTETGETTKATLVSHGRYNVTMDNGDKVFYTYTDIGSTDPSKPMSNKWKIIGGTGKYKGINGSGSCTGKNNADSSSDLTCTGSYMMGGGMAKSMDMGK